MIHLTPLFSAKNTQNITFKGNHTVSEKQNNSLSHQISVKNAPLHALQAYSNLGFGAGPRISMKFLNSPSVEALAIKYGSNVQADLANLQKRIGKPGQYLNWIGHLQKDQLKRVDEIYTLADKMKRDGGNGKLGLIGIGGSRHTVEAVLDLTGLSGKVEFLAGTDPVSIKDFMKKLGDLTKANIMVASKSGGTLEPNHGFKEVQKAFINISANQLQKEFPGKLTRSEARELVRDGLNDSITVITDKDPAKSQLRKLADKKGYKSGIIHDDCGGRFGAFDDHALVALAYSGMKKGDMVRMLKASAKAQEKFMSPDLSQNLAAQKAMFTVYNVLSGKTSHYNHMFGDRFEGATKWNTQKVRESIKAQHDQTDYVGPAYLHYAAESDLDKANKHSFYTITSIDNKKPEFKTYRAITNGVENAYAGQHPVAQVKMKGFTPEDIGEFIELNHMETIHTGMLLRSAQGKEHPPLNEAIPEVLQPNVEIYKKEVKKALVSA